MFRSCAVGGRVPHLCGPVLVHVFLASCSVLLGYRKQRCGYLLDRIVPALPAELVLFWNRPTAASSVFACSVLRRYLRNESWLQLVSCFFGACGLILR